MTAKKVTPAVALGHTVRDTVTGFTGTAIQLVELLSGTVQYAIQPKISNPETSNAVPDAMNFDVQLLEYIDGGVSAAVTPAEKTDIRLGNEVEDLATGFRGMVIARHTFINGCVYFHVLPKQNKMLKEKGAMPVSDFADCKRLKIVGAGLAPKAAPILEKPLSERTGGPMTRAFRI